MCAPTVPHHRIDSLSSSIRYVPDLGVLHLDFMDLIPSGRPDLLIRLLTPCDPESSEKLRLLESRGTAKAYDPDEV